MKVNILGTEYDIIKLNDKEYFDFSNADGIAEWHIKELRINADAEVEKMGHMLGMKDYYKSVVRHEIVHAFLYESGLNKYERDEMIVEWIARMIPKMIIAMKEADAL